MGSTSATESGGSSSSSLPTDSLNGLKFGRKIYFKNMCDGVAKSGGGSSSSAPAAHRKGRGGVFQSGHPPRCRVEGCNADLSDAKAYYARHKVCEMHSKFPMVIVAGLEQRFCQQCSRFHQLQEFDQGKRSCRRRLAGHNERRRKPPPGSLFSTQYAPLSPSIIENGSRVGSVARGEAWSPSRASGGRAIESHPSSSTGKTRNVSSQLVQNSTGGSCWMTHGIPLGECVTGVSSCALSLLSNQPWGSSNTPQALRIGAYPWINHQAMPTAKTTPHISSVDQFSSTSWGVKVNEDIRGSSGMTSDLGLCQIWPPCNASYSVDLELPHQVRRQYIDLSPQQAHWSL